MLSTILKKGPKHFEKKGSPGAVAGEIEEKITLFGRAPLVMGGGQPSGKEGKTSRLYSCQKRKG